jgi:hypothetical protein
MSEKDVAEGEGAFSMFSPRFLPVLGSPLFYGAVFGLADVVVSLSYWSRDFFEEARRPEIEARSITK